MSDLEHRARIDKAERRMDKLSEAFTHLTRMVCDGDTMVPPLSEASRNADRIQKLESRADHHADRLDYLDEDVKHHRERLADHSKRIREHKHVPSDIALDPPSSDKDGPHNLSDVLNIIAEAWKAIPCSCANLNTGDIDLTPIADRINQDSDVSNDNFARITARIDDLHARISILEEKASIHIANMERHRHPHTDTPAMNYPAGSQAICPNCKSMYAPGMACPVCYPVTTATG